MPLCAGILLPPLAQTTLLAVTTVPMFLQDTLTAQPFWGNRGSRIMTRPSLLVSLDKPMIARGLAGGGDGGIFTSTLGGCSVFFWIALSWFCSAVCARSFLIPMKI